MALEFKKKYVSAFVSDEEILSYQDKITAAHEALHNKTGAGSDFTGWVDLPVDYDKEEFAITAGCALAYQAGAQGSSSRSCLQCPDGHRRSFSHPFQRPTGQAW